MGECPFRAVFSLRNIDVDLIIKSFKTLEKEMRFSRGFVGIGVDDGGVTIVVCARDLASLRSLVNGVVKSLYLIFEIINLGA